MPEWPKGTDCKSVGLCLRRFETSPLHQRIRRGVAAGIAQLAERQPSKLRVAGSNPVSRSKKRLAVGSAWYEIKFALYQYGEGHEMRAAQGATKSGSEACRKARRSDSTMSQRRDATHIVARRRYAHVAQSVERVLGKDEVSGSIPLVGSRIQQG